MRFLICFQFLCLLLACGQKKDDRKNQIVDIPVFTQYHNTNDAPLPIANAAKAVVRVAEHGTGFFVSDDGILVTNNHVLGVSECIRSGCYVKIDFDFEVGQDNGETKTFFAEPLLLDVPLDLAAYQIKEVDADGKVLDKISTRHFLEFTDRTAASLLDEEVYVVGHPNANLKKWMTAKVFKDVGSWFYIDSLVLGGNSGSPVLDKEGNVVGLLHRGTEAISRNGAKGLSICSAANDLVAVLGGKTGFSSDKLKDDKKIDVLLDLDAGSITKSNAALYEGYLFAAHISKCKNDSGEEEHVLNALGDACDGYLMQDFSKLDSPDNGLALIQSCYAAIDWVNCPNTEEGKDFKTCPEVDDKQKWLDRMSKLTEKAREINFDKPYLFAVFGPTAFEKSQEDSLGKANSQLSDYLRKYSPTLDFSLANVKVLVAESSDDLTYKKDDLVDYLLNFEKTSYYKFYIEDIAQGLLALYDIKAISDEQTNYTFNKLFADADLALEEKLQVEMLVFQKGLLKRK